MVSRIAYLFLFLASSLLLKPCVANAQVCPSAAQRAEMLSLANRDNEGSAAQQRQRWQALIAAHQACGDVEAQAAALGAWSEHAMRKVAREEALTIETTRYALAVNAGLDRQRAESAARIGIALTSRGEKDLGHRRLREAVAIRNELAPTIELEASGGITLENIHNVAETGVERISSGALTHSAIVLDVALDWEEV